MATEYISREAMHKANQDEWQGVYGFVDCDIFEDNENMIERVPAADVRPVVRGKWIPTRKYGYCYKCSVCGEIGPLDPDGESAFKYNFCPTCGADMREVAKSDTRTKG